MTREVDATIRMRGAALWLLPPLAVLIVYSALIPSDFGTRSPPWRDDDLARLPASDPVFQVPWFPAEREYAPVSMAVEAVFGVVGSRGILSRITDVLLHAGATLLVYAICRRLAVEALIAALAAALFGVLAIHADAVASGLGRSLLLGTNALLGAWLLLLGKPGISGTKPSSHVALSFVVGGIVFAGLFASPVVGLLIPIVFLQKWFLRRPIPRLPLAAGLSAFCAYLIVRHAAVGLGHALPSFVDNPLGTLDDETRVLNSLVLLGRYLALLLFPARLSADYAYHSIPVRSCDSMLAWALAAAVILPLAWIALHSRRRLPLLALSIVLFVVAMAPFTHLLYAGRSMFRERYGYLAAMALPLALCALASTGPAVRRRRLCLGVLGGLVILHAGRTWLRCSDWSYLPLLRMAAEAPASVRGPLHEAEAYLTLWGRTDDPGTKERYRREFESRIDRGLEIYPDYPHAFFLRGQFLYNELKYKEAIEQFNLAHEMYREQGTSIPEPKLYRWRGECYFRLGQHAEAFEDLDRYVGILESLAGRPDEDTFQLRGLARAHVAQVDDLVQRVARQLAQAVGSTSYMTAAPMKVTIEMARTRLLVDALRDFNTAIGLRQDSPELWNNRAYCRFKLKDYEGAIRDYDKGLGVVKARNVLYAESGESVWFFLERIAEVYGEIARVRREEGRLDEAQKAETEHAKVRRAADGIRERARGSR